jgi:hypothetical protein
VENESNVLQTNWPEFTREIAADIYEDIVANYFFLDALASLVPRCVSDSVSER